MCTVTYLPLGAKDFILTSNRDESPHRETIEPEVYFEDGLKLIYPKDQLAGGTWIGLSELKRLVCLLNGGFEKHQRQSSYKMSRGVIVKDLLKVDDPMQYMDSIDLDNVEPFTVIFAQWDQSLTAHEWVWDGKLKHLTELNQVPRIWSSSPLYDSKMKSEREQWFQHWISENPQFTKESILEFHHNKDLGTRTTAPVMDRLFVKTVSISNIQKKGKQTTFYYKDLASNSESERHFNT